MGRRSPKAETEDLDAKRVELRVRLRLAEERGYAGEDQRELVRRITDLDKRIKLARGTR